MLPRPQGTSPTNSRWTPAILLIVLASGLSACRQIPETKQDEIPGGAVRLAPQDDSLSVFPAISPDGESIAWSSNRTGSFEIWVRRVGGGEPRRLTTDGADNVGACWSPDGKSIAYFSKTTPGIRVIPAEGGTPRILTSTGARPRWSPDGKSIAYQTGSLIDLSWTDVVAQPPSTIWTVSAAGGEPHQLTTPGTPPGGHGSPAWSPDGKRIVFAAGDARSCRVWSIPSEGGTPVVVGDRRLRNYDPVFTADGNAVLFLTATPSWVHAIERVPVSHATGAPTAPSETVVTVTDGAIKHLEASRDGTMLAYSLISTRSNLVSLPVSPGSGEPAGPPRELTNEAVRHTAHAFSPDGQWLAMVRWLPGVNSGDIWMMDLDGGSRRRLTANASFDFQPSFFPEGDRIAYLTTRDNRTALWSLDLATGREAPLAEPGQDMDRPRLAPDGRSFVFNSKNGGPTINLWRWDFDTRSATQLTNDSEMIGFACWSPDGKSLAAELRRGASDHIVVLPARGGTPVELTHEVGRDWPYGWSPDGDRIVYAANRGDDWSIRWISRSTGRTMRLTPDIHQPTYVRYPSWSPKGDRVVYEYAETRGSVWMMPATK